MKFTSIATKIFSYQILSWSLVILTMSMFQYWNVRAALKSRFVNSANNLLLTIEEVLREHPELFSTEKLQPVVLQLSTKASEVHRLSVTDHTFRIIADSNPGLVGGITDQNALIKVIQEEKSNSFEYIRDGHTHYRLSRPISGSYDPVRGSHVIGTFSIDLELININRYIWRDFLRFMLWVTGIVLALGLLLHMLTRRTVVQPLVTLTTAAESFLGDDVPTKIRMDTNDEMGTLSRALAKMMEDIRVSQSRLKVAKRHAESANNAKTQFLANMSHEIRTPLNSIVGFSRILLNRMERYKLSGEVRQFLQHINLSGQNLSELINNILDLAKIEANRMTISEEDVNLKLLVQGIYHINKAAAAEKNLRFSYSCAADVPEMIRTDRTKLNQILMNLASNAVKFTPENKAVVISVDREGDMIRLEVADQGIGIPKEKQATIFEAFEQADGSTTTREYGGTGLGLAITAKLSEILGGKLTLSSAPGEGSVFRFYLPYLPVSSKEAEKKSFKMNECRFSKNNRVLVVEDNPMNQGMLKSLFEDLGLEIAIAENGEESVRKTLELKPDLVLMDIHMPGMDGITAARQIRRHSGCETLPIVAVSAHAFKEQQKSAKRAGIEEYLTKPLDFDKLLPVLVKYLRQETSHLPEAVGAAVSQAEMREEFAKLAEISIYESELILDQIDAMRSRFESRLPDGLFTEIQNAAFCADEERYRALVDKYAAEKDG